ncbi:MAG: RNA methyltransferase [Nannocystaceae bacterium]
MPEVIALDRADDPRVARFRGSDELGPADPERFIAETEHAVERLLESGLAVESILATPARLARLAPRIPAGVATFSAPAPLLTAIVGFDRHRGVAACGRRPAAIDPAAAIEGRARVTVVVADAVVDPVNIGAILRAARAFACDLVLLDRRCGDPWSRRAIRAAMGNGFFLAIAVVDDLVAAVQRVRAAAPGLEVVVATTGGAAIPAGEFTRGDRLALVLGNEGAGVRAEILARADHEVTIPMAAGVDSLNVAAAAAVLLHQLGGLARPV